VGPSVLVCSLAGTLVFLTFNHPQPPLVVRIAFSIFLFRVCARLLVLPHLSPLSLPAVYCLQRDKLRLIGGPITFFYPLLCKSPVFPYTFSFLTSFFFHLPIPTTSVDGIVLSFAGLKKGSSLTFVHMTFPSTPF